MRIDGQRVAYQLTRSRMNQKTLVSQRRQRWKLSIGDLANLLGVRKAVIGQCEAPAARIDLDTALGLQVVLGPSPRELFPELYQRIEDVIMRRAAAVEKKNKERHDAVTKLHRRLFRAMVARASVAPAA